LLSETNNKSNDLFEPFILAFFSVELNKNKRGFHGIKNNNCPCGGNSEKERKTLPELASAQNL